MQSIIITLKTICCQLIETSFMVFQECDGFGLAFFLGKRNIMRRDVHVRCCNNDLCNLPSGFPRAQTTSHKPAIRTAATTLPRAQTTSHKPAIHTATTTLPRAQTTSHKPAIHTAATTLPRAQTTSHKPAIRTAATTLPRAQTTSHKPAIHTATTTIRPKPTVINSHSVGGGGGKKIIVQFQSPISLIYYTKAPKIY